MKINGFFEEGYDPNLSTNIDVDGLRSQGLLCSICLNIPRNAVTTKHSPNDIFCHNCLSKCPNDPFVRKKITKRDYREIAVINRRNLDNLILKCPTNTSVSSSSSSAAAAAVASSSNQYHECQWEHPLSGLDNHMKDDCQYVTIKCEFCDDEMLRQDMKEHVKVNHHLCEFCKSEDIRMPLSEYDNHLKICLKKPVPCPYCDEQLLRENIEEHIGDHYCSCEFCEIQLKRKEYDNHLKMVCPEILVDCLFHNNNDDRCNEKVKRKDLEQHINSSHSLFEMMVQTNEKLKKTNEKLTETNRKLTETNEELTMKIEFQEKSMSYLHDINSGRFKKRKYDDMSIYYGEFGEDGKANGHGIYYDKNGNRYEGEWKDGDPNGHGIEYHKNGDRFEGEYKDGNQQGIYYHNNGDRYEGGIKDTKTNGHGIVYFKNGDRFKGEWKDDKRSGHGILYYKNGDRFEVEFKNDKMKSHGILYYQNGDRFEVEFKNAKKNVYGNVYYKNRVTKECSMVNEWSVLSMIKTIVN